jgi:group I intron endonuclease
MNLQQPGIYLITHKESGKRYIGSAVRFDRRWGQHKYHLSRHKHCNDHLQNIYNKYGIDSLIFSVIEIVEDKTKLLEREQWYLDTWQPEINICKVAGSQLGRRHSQDTKAKLSVANKGKSRAPFTEEHRAKLSAANKGKSFTEEHKAKMSAAHSRRKYSECKGYTIVNRTKADGSVTTVYKVQINKKYYGYFLTEQEAVDKVREIRGVVITVH